MYYDSSGFVNFMKLQFCQEEEMYDILFIFSLFQYNKSLLIYAYAIITTTYYAIECFHDLSYYEKELGSGLATKVLESKEYLTTQRKPIITSHYQKRIPTFWW